MGIGDQQAGDGDGGAPLARSAFGQEPSAGNTLLMVVLCMALFFSLFKAMSWWQGDEAGPAALELRRSNRQQAPAAAPQVPPDQRPAGRSTGSQPADTTPATQAGPRASSVTKCVGRGGTVYSDGPCPVGATATTVDTPSDLNVSAGLAKGRAEPERQVPSASVPAPRDVDFAKNAAKGECDALTTESHKWDAVARQPAPGHAQDEIRARQREIRARKFELRC